MRRWSRWLWGVGIVLTLVVVFLLDLARDAGAWREVHPHGMEHCTRVPGPAGAEDLVFEPNSGLVLLSSQDFRDLEQPGGLYAWDPRGDAAPTPIPTDSTGPLHPHGLGLWRGPDGEERLFVVNHPTRLTSRVELFSVEPGPRLRHLDTFEDPLMVSLNDVAPVGPAQFYVTLDAATPADGPGRLVETFLRLPWSQLLYFDGHRGSVAATGFQYANGVAVTADGGTVFVSESSGRHLRAYRREPTTGALSLLATERFPAALDNLAFDADGHLWVAAHPNMLAFLAHADDPAKWSPSAVFEVQLVDAQLRVTEHAVDDGAQVSGSSVALPLGGGRFVVGTVFEHHLLDCQP